MLVIVCAAAVVSAHAGPAPLLSSTVPGTAVSTVPGTVEAVPSSRGPQGSAERLAIGLLLVAIDTQPDHLRISEALRVSNPGPTVTRDVRIALPPAAQYVTFHRGLRAPRETPDGFSDSIVFRTGITEIAYSYALAAGSDAVLSRLFPFRVRRMEIVLRGAGVRLTVREGVPLSPVRAGDQLLARWEVRDLPAGSPVVMALRGLPVSRPWIPAAVATALALVLVAGLLAALRRRA